MSAADDLVVEYHKTEKEDYLYCGGGELKQRAAPPVDPPGVRVHQDQEPISSRAAEAQAGLDPKLIPQANQTSPPAVAAPP